MVFLTHSPPFWHVRLHCLCFEVECVFLVRTGPVWKHNKNAQDAASRMHGLMTPCIQMIVEEERGVNSRGWDVLLGASLSWASSFLSIVSESRPDSYCTVFSKTIV